MVKTTDLFLSHNWGVGQKNHRKVIKINEELKKLGYVTWFDEEDMAGNTQKKMAEGIENTRCFVAFLTKEYHEKVNEGGTNDNCRAEFDYATTQNIPFVGVVLDSSMKNPKQWEGNIDFTLSKYLYIDMSGDLDDSTYLSNQLKLLAKELESREIVPNQTPSRIGKN